MLHTNTHTHTHTHPSTLASTTHAVFLQYNWLFCVSLFGIFIFFRASHDRNTATRTCVLYSLHLYPFYIYRHYIWYDKTYAIGDCWGIWFYFDDDPWVCTPNYIYFVLSPHTHPHTHTLQPQDAWYDIQIINHTPRREETKQSYEHALPSHTDIFFLN